MAFSCACRFTKNYFIPKYNLHTEFDGLALNKELEQALAAQNVTEDDRKHVLQYLQSERKRRETLPCNSEQRIEKIKESYNKWHPHLYKLQDGFLRPEFLKIVSLAKTPGCTLEDLVNLMETCCCKVWRFPVFTDQFCEEVVEEMCHFENSDMPKGRPNTMNNYGILLNEIGFDQHFLDLLRREYLLPIAKILLPEWTGQDLDSHKAFTVKYKYGEDLDLAFHFDNAEVTLNVCLGKDFEGGCLYFGRMRTEPMDLMQTTPVLHKKGYGILHRGQHRHGAMEIEGEESERHNLIIWMRSSSVRNKLCPMCNEKPQLVSQTSSGDGFTMDSDAETSTQNSSCNVT